MGFDEGGQLTEQVRRRPYSVVLFDEIEKVHPDIFNSLLQVLDDGRLTDGQGRTVSFRNSIIIMTSNIGTEQAMARKQSEFSQDESYDERSDEKIKDIYFEALRRHLKPEFINRIDVVSIFHPLTMQDLAKIATIMVASINKRLSKQGLELKITSRALEFIVERGANVIYGARPLKRFIQQEVEDRIAEKILLGELEKQGVIIIDVRGNDLSFVMDR